MNRCYDCQKEVEKGIFRCDDCYANAVPDTSKSLRPMTDWERLKLGFYRSDKKWEENIRSRKFVSDPSTGKKTVVYETARGRLEPLPTAPSRFR